jgi:energy-converting hydrogenase Eha subunit H
MSPEMIRVLLGAFSIWGIAVAFKAMTALNKREPYTFSMWDGGMMRAGRRLNRLGTQIKLFVGIALAAACIVVAAGIYYSQTMWLAVLGIAVVGLISDFANSES